jgi:geranylgeranyl diphosphate synthase type I
MWVMVGIPASLAEVGNRVGTRIDALLAGEEERWILVDAGLEEPFEALRAIIAGGKRLRPAFCFWGWVGAGGDPGDHRIVDAGAALELLHISALIHDDVMDDSARRHGVPAIHVDFADRHIMRTWHGEPRRFGDGAAILIGDLAFVYADLLIGGAPADVVDVWNELRLEVNIGQYLDLIGTAAHHVTPERARTIAVYKSGKYTIERPLHLGAALAGRLPELSDALTAFGVPLGEAFQLRDDLLGAFGDPTTLGKDVGEDLRSGKPTLLLALARERGLDGEPTADRLIETGAKAAVEERVAVLRQQALDALASAPVTERARTGLRELAEFVTRREH